VSDALYTRSPLEAKMFLEKNITYLDDDPQALEMLSYLYLTSYNFTYSEFIYDHLVHINPTPKRVVGLLISLLAQQKYKEIIDISIKSEYFNFSDNVRKFILQMKVYAIFYNNLGH